MALPLDCFLDFSAQQERLPIGLSRTRLSGSLRHKSADSKFDSSSGLLVLCVYFAFLRLFYPLLGITDLQII
jgi:hypothetical protein